MLVEEGEEMWFRIMEGKTRKLLMMTEWSRISRPQNNLTCGGGGQRIPFLEVFNLKENIQAL
jgi:hypothetical protein